MSPPRIDLRAAMRAQERDFRQFDQQAKARNEARRARPRTPRAVGAYDPGMMPDELAEDITASRARREEPISILCGRREWKRFKALDGAGDHLEYWPGGEETFLRVAIIIRKGAGGIRLFTDLDELDAAVKDLPQSMTPAPYRR